MLQRERAKRLLAGITLLGAGFMAHAGPPPPKLAVALPVKQEHVPEVPLPTRIGPPWPPTMADWESDLAQDAWIHPMPGPIRRMPLSDSRIFGAERPGDRPAECRNGHCGVDLGGEIWGEHVFAAHDGVVDRVVNIPNESHGGHYVRLSHRGGTVFTQYFHLAAIARGLAPGVQVRAGDIIGLLGDTGVKESTAHLHFTISVRPSYEWPERYMDPEPLIALWPLKIPVQGSVVGLVTTMSPAAQPLGVPPHKSRQSKSKKTSRKRQAADVDKAETEKAAPAEPAD